MCKSLVCKSVILAKPEDEGFWLGRKELYSTHRNAAIGILQSYGLDNSAKINLRAFLSSHFIGIYIKISGEGSGH